MTKKKPKPASSSAQSTNQAAEDDSAVGPVKQKTPGPASALIISRNKHWRHISCYHGSWLNLSIEVLESLAYSNYSSPRPRPIDPAVLFDLVKIRKLVDEATDLAVRAANGTGTSAMQSTLSSSKGRYYGNDAEMLGLSGPRGMVNTKLSRERRHRMRDHATQKLYQAYSLDEIAASVIMMQSASALEDVAKLVLEREDNNPYAQYVHFFHEKVPSMNMPAHTTLDSLHNVINQNPTDASPYRTKAATRMFKDDFEGAVRDCTDGLAVHKLYHAQHQKNQQDLVPPKDAAALGREFQPKGRVADKDQPSSMEPQLLCLRGSIYLTLAVENIKRAVDRLPKGITQQADVIADPPAVDSGSKEDRQRAEARRLGRTYAKRALRDYLSFLSHFEYTPGHPLEYTAQFVDAKHGPPSRRNSRTERLLDVDSHLRMGMSQALVQYESLKDRVKNTGCPKPPPPPIYKLNELFAAVPPADVPIYDPERDKKIDPNHPIFSLPDFAEAVTYHPLMIEVLHSLLLCHCIIQTSNKELQRHAYMVARLQSITDGYPVFLAPRSAARADWMEILDITDNWLGLPHSWTRLCIPAYLVDHFKEPLAKDRKEKRIQEKLTAHMQALADEGITGGPPSQVDYKGREPGAASNGEGKTRKQQSEPSGDVGNGSLPKLPDWPLDDESTSGLSERTEVLVQWILEGPRPSATDGTGRSKKKLGAKGGLKKTGNSAPSLPETEMKAVDQRVESLNLSD